MWRQILTQIWNQRRANAWVWAELLVVTVLLWYGIDVIYNYEGAALHPKGYDTSCVFDLKVENKPVEIIDSLDNVNAGEDFAYLYNLIREYPGVEEACYYYGSIPYSNEDMHEGYATHQDSTRVVGCCIRYVSASYFKVFRLKPTYGQLDEQKWRQSEYPMPAFMSEDLADSLFHTTGADALGQTCFNPYLLNYSQKETNYRVMGVLPRHKLDDYQRYEPFIYLPSHDRPIWWQNVGIRVSPDHVAGFAERFRRDMQQTFDRGIFYLKSIRSYDDMKAAYDIEQGTVNYLNTVYAVIAFFGFNIFLSILGTFWYRTRKRRCEIALRMAMGSSRRATLHYYVMEGLSLLVLAAIPALIICLNIYIADLTVHTLMDATMGRLFCCFAATLVVLAIIILIGIWYPAHRAMKIQPAEALHDE